MLRGLALLGVLVVNIGEFSGADLARESGVAYPLGWGGRELAFLCATLLESKAAALLAMLFGAGLAIQWDNARRAGRAAVPFAMRRVGALALLGVAHSVLLWNVDILFDYALISLLVLPFLSLRASRVLWAIPALLVVTALIAAPFIKLADPQGEAAWTFANALRHYGQGSWLEALQYRVWELLHVMGPMRISNRLPILTPFFILGVYFWRNGFLSEPARHRNALRQVFAWCFVLGLAANLVPKDWLHSAVAGIPIQPLRILIKATAFFARPALTVGYAAGILLLIDHERWRRLLAVFAPLGRTTLTQYLMQSVVCTWVFNGYGLGLYGKVPVSACLVGAVALYALQVWSSQWWLARFRTGPVEWLWRRMTYGAPPRLPAASG